MGDTWYLDELFVTIRGQRQYLWRAVDEDGDVIDILVQSRRNRLRGRPLLSDIVEERRLCATPVDHGQAAQLHCNPLNRDAGRRPHHGPVREQSRRSLTSRADDCAKLQERRQRARPPFGQQGPRSIESSEANQERGRQRGARNTRRRRRFPRAYGVGRPEYASRSRFSFFSSAIMLPASPKRPAASSAVRSALPIKRSVRRAAAATPLATGNDRYSCAKSPEQLSHHAPPDGTVACSAVRLCRLNSNGKPCTPRRPTSFIHCANGTANPSLNTRCP